MSTVRFQRKARREMPRTPGGEVTLQPPPEIPRVVPGNLLSKLLPVVMVVAMVGMMAMLFTSGGFGANPMSLMFPAMMVFSMVGMFAGQGRSGAPRPAEANEDRKDYLRYLDQLRDDVHDTRERQHAALSWSHPAPGPIWTLVGTRRMWERRVGDPDYCHVRIGVGPQGLATRLIAPETGPVEELEPVAAVALRRFVRAHSVVEMPLAVSLRGFAAIGFDGDRTDARALVRSMLAQMCMFHGPDQLQVAVVCGPDTADQWEWVKWLPHAQHPDSQDGVGSQRMFYGSILELDSALRSLLLTRNKFARTAPAQAGVAQLVVVVDGGILDTDGEGDLVSAGGVDSVTMFDLCGYAPRLTARGLPLVIENGELFARSAAGLEKIAQADRIGVQEAQQLARRLAPFRVAAAHIEDRVTDAGDDLTNWTNLIGIGDVGSFNPEHAWRPRHGRERLRVPIGLGPDGVPVELDIKEAAENGMGPHGLCIGATGSGKSEFLRTLVLGMLATHSPDQLNFVLVDFKGGATFLGLDTAPHVSAVITNLEEEAALVDRMRDALAGEMNRRQELLRAAGNFANVGDYEKARAAGAELDPLPALFVVIDEFSELLAQQPEFAELFVAIGRLGRSLQMHLLLASQRLDEGKLRGLDSHLSYRIGLKTFSANESRAVLGVPDAYHLPASPGAGYLKSDASQIQRFQAAYVSAPYVGVRGARSVSRIGETEVDARPREFPAHAVAMDRLLLPAPEPTDSPEPEPENTRSSTLQVVVDRVRGHGRPAHKIWLDPLDVAPSIDQLVPGSVLTEFRTGMATLRTPIGLIDRPYDQRRDPMFVDLSGAKGNVAIVGGPQSGKSTALRSLIMSMAATHSPRQVQFYCLDFGGGTLAGLAGLPHVGSVAGRLDSDRVRRTVAEMTTIVRRREETFRRLGIESMADFRRLRAEGDEAGDQTGLADDPFGDAFLVIDGYGSIRQDFEALEQTIINLAVQGLSYGVHVVIAAARWGEVRPAMKDQLGSRIELRLGDPSDSDLGRKFAMLVPEGRPGRGMTKEGLHLLTALPRLDGDGNPANLTAGVVSAVATIAARDRGVKAPQVRMLPDRLTRDDMVATARAWPSWVDRTRKCMQIPVGLNESELSPIYLNFDEQPHLLIFGDTECGKSTLLRGICEGIVSSNTDMQARLIIADYRRTMLGAIETPHVVKYVASADQLTPVIGGLVDILRERMPGPDVDQRKLRERSWWAGPDVFLVVDDYDLVATSSGNPLAPLAEYLPHAKDLGFHLIIARRSGGAARALYEPVIARLRDLVTPGVVMSGSRDEGALVGNVRASAMPPGRGTYVNRNGSELVQFAWMPPL
ncbi:type VII secretion protein EccCa [Aldersonia sp. NBC_00410]|uniref:type VII secretion protein EccCa n=1 Tax=Aldersonia sp. NBC_00410 TaxID=2975954 RepID=UPI002253D5D0|nr:type VII secretion protein EccCa [Aldersonia sp. NBC_00410]MCX5043932.1 type VII secretion protein EccCa [Aldersonia sp. NBC_00410]